MAKCLCSAPPEVGDEVVELYTEMLLENHGRLPKGWPPPPDWIYRKGVVVRLHMDRWRNPFYAQVDGVRAPSQRWGATEEPIGINWWDMGAMERLFNVDGGYRKHVRYRYKVVDVPEGAPLPVEEPPLPNRYVTAQEVLATMRRAYTV